MNVVNPSPATEFPCSKARLREADKGNLASAAGLCEKYLSRMAPPRKHTLFWDWYGRLRAEQRG